MPTTEPMAPLAAVLLPTATYGLLVACFLRPQRAMGLSLEALARALVLAHLAVFALVALSTEMLSAAGAVTYVPVLAAWSLLGLVSLVLAWKQRSWRVLRRAASRHTRAPMTGWTATLAGALLLIVATTLVTALIYPPNTWDSMSYHMARVAHWEANQSIEFFPTSITRQNYQMPLAELAILHVQILSGSDRFANLVQWTSFLALICLATLIAAELGLDKPRQLLAAVMIATVPMAILQASSTQNDLVVSSFVMAFAWLLLLLRRSFRARTLLLAGCALGFALLTKGTAYLFCAAVGTALSIPILWDRRADTRRLLAAFAGLGSVVFIALSINAGHLARNHQLYGHPLSTESKHYRNAESSGKTLLANIVRNGASHLATPSARVNEHLKQAVRFVLGPEVSNPKTTWQRSEFDVRFTRHESRAGNLLHMLIVLPCLVFLSASWCRRQLSGRGPAQQSATIGYAFGTALAALIYCWVLKWQPWAPRLHLPLFALAAPLLAASFSLDTGIRKQFGQAITLIIIAYSLVFLFANESRSLISLDWYTQARTERYFTIRKNLLPAYEQIVAILRAPGVRDIGLYLRYDDWEYPFWVLLQQQEKGDTPARFRHVGVSNSSKSLGTDLPLPRFVIASKPLDTWRHAPRYTRVFASSRLSLYRRSE